MSGEGRGLYPGEGAQTKALPETSLEMEQMGQGEWAQLI